MRYFILSEGSGSLKNEAGDTHLVGRRETVRKLDDTVPCLRSKRPSYNHII